MEKRRLRVREGDPRPGDLVVALKDGLELEPVGRPELLGATPTIDILTQDSFER